MSTGDAGAGGGGLPGLRAGLEGDGRCEKSEGVKESSGCCYSRFPVHVGNQTWMSSP